MNNFLSLLTIVSNNVVPEWIRIVIQVSMWVAVASQIFLLVPDLIYTIRTRDTRENKWFKWIVWFVCSACWIIYSVFLIAEDIPISEIVGLAISEGVNLICLFIIYGIKIRNIVIAKRLRITEKQWCALLHTMFIAKKTLSDTTKQRLRKACKNLTIEQRTKLYIKALKKFKVQQQVNKTIKHTATKVAKKVIKAANKKKR